MNKDPIIILSSNLVRIRIRNRYSQREIADELGIAQSSYNRMEAGISKLSALQLYTLAKFYRILIDELFDPKAEFDGSKARLEEDLALIGEQLIREKVMYRLILNRNSELEDKIKRRDKKIDSLIKDKPPGEGGDNKIQSSATLSTIAISIIILSIIISMMLMYGQLTFVFQKEEREQRLTRNTQSALNLLISDSDFYCPEGFDLYGHGRDSVAVGRKLWGVYEAAYMHAFNRGDTVKKTALLGRSLPDSGRFALYLKDDGRPLSVSGNTQITGNAYFPASGIRKAYFEGRPYSGNLPEERRRYQSLDSLPTLESMFIAHIRSMLSTSASDHIPDDQIINMPTTDLNVPFDQSTVYIILADSVNLGQVALTGNIILHSTGLVEVESDAHLEDILVFAPTIRVRQGFKGALQLFARDSIRLEKNVELTYPSAIGVSIDSPYRENTIGNVTHEVVFLEEGVSITGVVFCDDPDNSVSRTLIRITDSVQVYGQVFSPGYLELSGKVTGVTHAGGFILQTPTTLYENFILDGILDSENLSKFYVGSPMINNDGRTKLLKWL